MALASTISMPAVVGLALLAVTLPVGSAQAAADNPCAGLQPWALFVKGKPIEQFVVDIEEGRENLNSFIEELRTGLDLPGLTELVRRMDEAPGAVQDNVPDALRGISGFSTILVLKRVLPRTDQEDSPPIANQVLYGKIRDYTFVKGSVVAGKVHGDGHLSVDMCTDRIEFVPLGQDRREFYHWDVEIVDEGFSIHQRQDPADPADPTQYDNPFPDANLTLPAAATDPANPRSVWRRGLDHKLHAEGPTVRVRSVYRRDASSPDLKLLPPDHWSYGTLQNPGDGSPVYATDETCVDLFTQGEPPATFGELVQRDYCLGRCAQPQIVNTGGG